MIIDPFCFDFRHFNGESTYVWKITMKNTMIFIVCLAERHPKKAVIGTQYAVHRSSEWKSIETWDKAGSENTSLFSTGIAPNILSLFQLSPTLRSWYSVPFISIMTRISISSTKTNAGNYSRDLPSWRRKPNEIKFCKSVKLTASLNFIVLNSKIQMFIVEIGKSK